MIRSLGVALIAALLCLMLAEGMLRACAPLHLSGLQGTYQYDEELGYRMKPGLHEFELTDFLDEIYTNELGTVNYQDSFGGYRERVFALGDSYTQGTGLPPDASYPFQLDLELNLDGSDAYEKRFAVVNLGLAAFGTEQSLRVLQRFAHSLGPPRYCLYLGCDNDAADDTLFLSGYHHSHIVDGSPVWGRFAGPLLWAGRLELFKRAKLAVGVVRRERLGVGGHSAPDGADLGGISVAERVWPTIGRVRAECERQGAAFIVSWADHDSPSYAWAKRAATAEGIPFADWWSVVQSVVNAIPEAPLENPHSSGHYRTWVNRIIARTFASHIRALHEKRGDPVAAPAGNR